MPNRDPIRSLSSSLELALNHDLRCPDAVPDEFAPDNQKNFGRRPREDECDVVLFGQVWPSHTFGCPSASAPRYLEMDTTVIVGPAQDACVYASTRLVYHILHPNRRFYLDVAAHSMAPKSEADAYEGRDDPLTEAVDIEVEAMLARLHAQVQVGEPKRASLVASYLHRCAARFEGSTCSPSSERWAPAPTDERLH